VTITATKRVPWKKAVKDKSSHQESKLSLMVVIVVVVTIAAAIVVTATRYAD
jgi:uncharacterized membrane protein